MKSIINSLRYNPGRLAAVAVVVAAVVAQYFGVSEEQLLGVVTAVAGGASEAVRRATNTKAYIDDLITEALDLAESQGFELSDPRGGEV